MLNYNKIKVYLHIMSAIGVSIMFISRCMFYNVLYMFVFMIQMMAVTDNLFLASSGLCQISSALLEYIGQPHHPLLAYEAVLIWPIVHFSQMLAVWTTLFVAFSRYIAICRPFQAARLCTMKRTRIQSACLVIFVFIYNIPRFLEYRVGTSEDPVTGVNYTNYIPTSLKVSSTYNIVYESIFYCLFVYLGPLVVLVVLNSCLFRELWASQRRLDKLMGRSAGNSSNVDRRKSSFAAALFRKTSNDMQNVRCCNAGNSQSFAAPPSAQAEENSLTLVMVVIVLIFIICQTPAFANQLLYYTLGADCYVCGHSYYYYFHISNVFVSSNSVVNFVIYCIFRKQFRDRLRRYFIVYCTKNDEQATSKDYSSSNTTYSLVSRHGKDTTSHSLFEPPDKNIHVASL